MMMISRYLGLCLWSLLALLPLQAQLPDFGFAGMGDVAAPSKITVETSASVNSYKKGDSFYLGYTLDCESPWHAYFRNPATVGMPLSVSMSPVEGFLIEGPYWSMPTREESSIGVSYSYHKAQFVWLVTPEEKAPASATFSIKSTAQLCSETGCDPPSESTASLTLSEGDGSANTAWAQQEQAVEVLGDSRVELAATRDVEGAVTLLIQSPLHIDKAYFFSEDNSIDPLAEQSLRLKDGEEDLYELTLPRNEGKDGMYPAPASPAAGEPITQLKGLLLFGEQHATVDIPVTEEVSVIAAAPVVASANPLEQIPSGFWAVVTALFAGGLILNLMPCVFPIIGLKIMGFVELADGSRRKIFFHCMAFVLGVLVSFWMLSLILIIVSKLDILAGLDWTQWGHALWFDTGSEARSWATWMGNPWVVYVLMLVLLILGLSMYGLFEVGVSATGAGQNLQRKKGMLGSFFSGLLATLVATPCSAPFLGTSLPLAMSMPAVWMIIAMSFMALGLSFPYVIIGIYPSMVKLLPKPGAWMESLKQGLSFLLFAAIAWLIDVYLAFVPDQFSPDIPWMLIGLVIICSAFWVYGRWCPLYQSKTSRRMGLIVALALFSLGVISSMPRTVPEEGSTAASIEWVDWSPELMEKTLAEGKTVYVDFTAKWCMTCQFNKKTAYSDDVYDKMRDSGVVLMRADKTSPNAAIDTELRRLGRSSVPVNVLYQKEQEPAITRELLTADYMLDFLNTHLSPSSK